MCTAIKRKAPSAPAQWLHKHGLILYPAMDYGCGYGKDADEYGLDKYDPRFYPEAITGNYQTILCTYVLNAMPNSVTCRERLREMDGLLCQTGSAYITVRRDLGCLTGKTRKGHQYHVLLDLPIVARKHDQYVIYSLKKGEHKSVQVAMVAYGK